MIDAKNFCHIEELDDGAKVLFWVEYEGGECIIHQITTLDVGTIGLKITMPEEKVEELWPDHIRFKDAAAKVMSVAAEMGFSARAAA